MSKQCSFEYFVLCVVYVKLVESLIRIDNLSPVTWYDADKYCKDYYNTHLISINNNETNFYTFDFCVNIIF